jgi:hypothetical protein
MKAVRLNIFPVLEIFRVKKKAFTALLFGERGLGLA